MSKAREEAEKWLETSNAVKGMGATVVENLLTELSQYQKVIEAFNDSIITFEIILPQINETDKPSIVGNISYYKEVLSQLNE